MRRRPALGRSAARSVVATTLCLALTAAACSDSESSDDSVTVASTDAPSACDAGGQVGELRAQLSAQEPGVGIADYPGYPVADIPKATAVILIAEVGCVAASSSHDRTLMDDAGESLLSWPERFPSDSYGWGLPFEWDAFGDGSVNPANTVYSISTGVAVKALLDWAEVSSSDVRERVSEVVDRALGEWLDPAARAESGQLVYSLSSADRAYDVFNSSAMLAGQMQRFAASGDSADAEDLRQGADRVVRSLIDEHQVDPAGNWYWNYSTVEFVANDMTHAGYIVDGVVTYATHDGALAAEIPVADVVDHLLAFRGDGTFPELMLPWPIWRSAELEDQYRLLRLYEVGWSLYIASQHSSLESLIGPLCQIGARHRNSEGHFQKYALDVDIGDVPNPEIAEYVAYYYLGRVSIGTRPCPA